MRLKNGVVVGILLVIAVAFIIYSGGNLLTGSVTAAISTVDVIVLNESDEVVMDAKIYVNGDYKGTTNKYGVNKGSKQVVLNGKKNVIMVKSEGYTDSQPLTLGATDKGRQQVVIRLEKLRTEYEVIVQGHSPVHPDGPLEGALVSLYQDATPLKTMVTPVDGKVSFGTLDDGVYMIKASKKGYTERSLEERINLVEDGSFVMTTIVLERLPRIVVTVRNADDVYVPETEVSLFAQRDYNAPGGSPLHIRYTNAEGVVEFDDITPDSTYIIVAKKDGYEAVVLEKFVSVENGLISMQLQGSQR